MEFAEDDLRADFQEVYTLNLDDMGDGYSIPHAAVCAVKLPSYSRSWQTFHRLNPPEKPTQGKRSKSIALPIDELNRRLSGDWKEAEDAD